MSIDTEERLRAYLRPTDVPPVDQVWAGVEEAIREVDAPLEMTLVEHLDELRSRLIKSVGALAASVAAALIFTPKIFELLIYPAPDIIKTKGLVFLEPTEAFLTYFQVVLMTGVGIASPVLLYQALAFIVPGLTRRERRLLFSSMPLVVGFFAVGIAFGYFVTLPFALKYLIDFTIEGFLTPFITVGSYIGFVTTILFWMGIAFETPVVLWVAARLGIVEPRRLAGYRKYAILAAFVIAAVITPTPDPLNQALVAIPLWVLYEIGILLARLPLGQVGGGRG
jgi:sec-independent protein translocase protein TatC